MKRALVFMLMMWVSLFAISYSKAEEGKESDRPKLSGKELKRQSTLKVKAERFGVGAEIRVVMRGSPEKVVNEGLIEDISDDRILLKTKDWSLELRYSKIESLSLWQSRYDAKNASDPIQVRRVVLDIGIGQKAKVELASSKRFRGIIRSIDKEYFVISSKSGAQSIPFNEVKKVEKSHLPAWAKAAIATGAVAGAILTFGLVLYATGHVG